MSSNEKFVWLASYPKSGNTWLRIFLDSMITKSDSGFSINNLSITEGISSNRYLFEKFVGVDSEYLTLEEIDYFLPKVFEKRADQLESRCYVKTHSSNIKNKSNQFLFPEKITEKVIYIVRNPLDVCVSMAFHSGNTNFDLSTKNINNSNFYLANDHLSFNLQLHQFLGDWSMHYKSWVNSMNSDKILVLRYEDMSRNPIQTFRKVISHLDLKYDETIFKQALENSSFKNLSNQEADSGFRERPSRSKRFFRKGKVNGWIDYLSNKNVDAIIDYHRETMIELEYLTPEGMLVNLKQS